MTSSPTCFPATCWSQLCLLILAVKAAIWLVALSSGTSGGVLAPLLILGGAMGWLVGMGLPGTPGFWALLGMAAMLGGTMRAPLTGALFAVELTGNLTMLPALLAATASAYGVTVLLLRRSMLTEKLARRGQHITREYSVDPYELTRVGELMVRDVATLPADLPLAEAVQVLEAGLHRIYPVLDGRGRPAGTVSRADALRWKMEALQAQAADDETVGDRMPHVAHPAVHPQDVVSHAVDLNACHRARPAGCHRSANRSDGRLAVPQGCAAGPRWGHPIGRRAACLLASEAEAAGRKSVTVQPWASCGLSNRGLRQRCSASSSARANCSFSGSPRLDAISTRRPRAIR